jgi:hypothetical protein
MDQRTKQAYEQKLGKESLKLTQILHIQRGKNDKTRQLLQLLKEVTENDEKPILMFRELEERVKRIDIAEAELTDHINKLMAQCGEKMNDLRSGRFKVPENSQQTKRQTSSNTHLKSNEQEAMRIIVQIWEGKGRIFEVYPSDLVKDLKYIIERVENIPSEHQQLRFNAIPLENHRTLGDYKIGSWSKLYVIINVRDY